MCANNYLSQLFWRNTRIIRQNFAFSLSPHDIVIIVHSMIENTNHHPCKAPCRKSPPVASHDCQRHHNCIQFFLVQKIRLAIKSELPENSLPKLSVSFSYFLFLVIYSITYWRNNPLRRCKSK